MKTFSNYYYNELLRACQKDDLVKLKTLIDMGMEINYQNKQGYCLLSAAVECSSLNCLQFLIDNKIVIPDYSTEKNRSYLSFLQMSFRSDNQKDALEMILKYKSINLLLKHQKYHYEEKIGNRPMQEMNATFLGSCLQKHNSQLLKVALNHLENKETNYIALLDLSEYFFSFYNTGTWNNGNNKRVIKELSSTIEVILDNIIENEIKVNFNPKNKAYMENHYLKEKLEAIRIFNQINDQQNSTTITKKIKI